MERVIELFEDLSRQYSKQIVTTPPGLLNTSIDLKLRERHIMPRLEKSVALGIARSARRGDLRSMGTLSMMYGVGLGVPKDETLCMCWASMSVNEAPHIDIDVLHKKLNTHLNAIQGDYVYPSYIVEGHRRSDAKIVKAEDMPKLRGQYRIAPVYKGVQLNLTYCFSGNDCYLFDAYTLNTNRVLLDKLHKLDVPKQFGSIRNNVTIPDYHNRIESVAESKVKYVVVSGTLVIPNSVKKYVQEAYPDCSSVGELFNLFLNDNRERVPFNDRSGLDDLNAQLESQRAKLATVESGEYAEELKALYQKRKSRFERNRTHENREEALAVKSEYDSLRSGDLQRSLLREIHDLVEAIENCSSVSQHNRLVHKYSYLENAFKFVASDIYYCKFKKRKVLPLATAFKDHMQTVGFDGTTLNEVTRYLVDASDVDLAELISQFDDPEYNVHSIIFRPVLRNSDSVKNVSQPLIITL